MRRLALSVAWLTVAVMFFGVLPAHATVSSEERSVELSVFSKINDKRASLSKGQLTEHPFMRSKAEAHSDAMARRHQLGHFGFSRRVQAIEANDSGIKDWICENVAYVSGSGIGAAQAASMLYNGWLNSPPHRKCMLDQEGHTTQSAGIGVTHAGNTWWATFIGAHDNTP